MSGQEDWVQVSSWRSVKFSAPCRGAYCYIRHIGINIGCDYPDERHGHIELADEEGSYAFVSFPCYSRAGVKEALALLSGELLFEERHAILGLEGVEQLPEQLTEEEKIFLRSLTELPEAQDRLKAVFCGWWGV